MRRVRVSLASVAGLLAVGVAAPALAAGPYPPPSKGTGRVEPSRISVGECATFSGDGFRPVSAVAITDDGVARGSATTSTQGTFSFRLCYASDAQKGRHDLAGAGNGASGDPLTVNAVLIVQGVRQSANNPSTQSGGAASSTTGGTDSGTTTEPESAQGTTESESVQGTTGAIQEGPVLSEGSPVVPAGTENSGTRLIMLGVAGIGFAFLASLLLLLAARRRRRREDDGGADAALMPA